MNPQGIRRALAGARKTSAYWTERAVLDFTSALWQVMQRRRVSQSELSRRLGKNPAFVSRILNGASNVTIKTIVEMAHALDARVHIDIIEAESKPMLASVTTLEANSPRELQSARVRVSTRAIEFSPVEYAANDGEHEVATVA